MYLLFYSNYCKYCKKFIDVLEKIPEAKYFNPVCVDKKNGKRDDLVFKYKIKEVPTIIVDSRYYVGKDCFAWLSSKIKDVNSQVSSHNTRNNKTILSPNSNNTGNFALLNSEIQENFAGTSNFCSLNYQEGIPTPEEGEDFSRGEFHLPNDDLSGLGNGGIIKDESSKSSSKEDEVKKQIEYMTLERERQDSIYKSKKVR